MRTDRWLAFGAAVLTAGFEVLILAAPFSSASAASPEPCDMRLGVVLAPDVPAASDDTQTVAIVTDASPKAEKAHTHLSLAGLGSLYWAARNPGQAWRVLLPVQAGDVAYGDIRTRCVLSTNTSSAGPACP